MSQLSNWKSLHRAVRLPWDNIEILKDLYVGLNSFSTVHAAISATTQLDSASSNRKLVDFGRNWLGTNGISATGDTGAFNLATQDDILKVACKL